jgi:hypothetical protein
LEFARQSVVRAVSARKLHINKRTLEKWEQGRVYDPCCGSGGMFVSSEKFIEAHSGRIGDISIYGQESNYTTWNGSLRLRSGGQVLEYPMPVNADKPHLWKADARASVDQFNQ